MSLCRTSSWTLRVSRREHAWEDRIFTPFVLVILGLVDSGHLECLVLFEMDFLPAVFKSAGLLNEGVVDNVTKASTLRVVTACLAPLGLARGEMDRAALLGMVGIPH